MTTTLKERLIILPIVVITILLLLVVPFMSAKAAAPTVLTHGAYSVLPDSKTCMMSGHPNNTRFVMLLNKQEFALSMIADVAEGQAYIMTVETDGVPQQMLAQGAVINGTPVIIGITGDKVGFYHAIRSASSIVVFLQDKDKTTPLLSIVTDADFNAAMDDMHDCGKKLS